MLNERASTREMVFRPEAQLLLACARSRMDSETAEQIRRLVAGDLDWDYVIRKADEHFITPLLYNSIVKICPEALPKRVLEELRNRFHSSARRNLFMAGELLRIVDVLRQNGIEALPYKGPMLAATAYDNLALRSFIDLDILINERNILKAKQVLMSAGYEPRTQLTEKQEAAHIRSRAEKDIVLVRHDGTVSVELHWGVASLFLFPLDAEVLWNRLEEVNLGAANVLSLGPEDTLLVLCVHGAKHSFQRVQWIADIAEVLRSNPQVDWDRMLSLAISLRSKRMLFLGLQLSSKLLGAPIPRMIARQIGEDPYVESLVTRVMAGLFRDAPAVSNIFEAVTFRGRLGDAWADRVRLRLHSYLYKFNLAWTPNDQDRVLLRLPGYLSFLYYLMRPVRLLGVYGVGLFLQRLKLSKRQ